MAWANQEVLSRVSQFPDEALQSFISDPEWTARAIIEHFATSAGFYEFRLGGLEIDRITGITSMEMLKAVLPTLAKYDSLLLARAAEQERVVEVHRGGEILYCQFSTILSQAIHHATEHRAQLIQALEFKGYTGISLDDFDLWAFEVSTERNRS